MGRARVRDGAETLVPTLVDELAVEGRRGWSLVELWTAAARLRDGEPLLPTAAVSATAAAAAAATVDAAMRAWLWRALVACGPDIEWVLHDEAAAAKGAAAAAAAASAGGGKGRNIKVERVVEEAVHVALTSDEVAELATLTPAAADKRWPRLRVVACERRRNYAIGVEEDMTAVQLRVLDIAGRAREHGVSQPTLCGEIGISAKDIFTHLKALERARLIVRTAVVGNNGIIVMLTRFSQTKSAAAEGESREEADDDDDPVDRPGSLPHTALFRHAITETVARAPNALMTWTDLRNRMHVHLEALNWDVVSVRSLHRRFNSTVMILVTGGYLERFVTSLNDSKEVSCIRYLKTYPAVGPASASTVVEEPTPEFPPQLRIDATTERQIYDLAAASREAGVLTKDVTTQTGLPSRYVLRVMMNMKASGLVRNDILESVGRQRRFRFTVTNLPAADAGAVSGPPPATAAAAAPIAGSADSQGTAGDEAAGEADGDREKPFYRRSGVSVTFQRRRALIAQWLEEERVINYVIENVCQRMSDVEQSKFTVDRKTVQALIDHMESNGLLRKLKIALPRATTSANSDVVYRTLLLHPSLTPDSPEVQMKKVELSEAVLQKKLGKREVAPAYGQTWKMINDDEAAHLRVFPSRLPTAPSSAAAGASAKAGEPLQADGRGGSAAGRRFMIGGSNDDDDAGDTFAAAGEVDAADKADPNRMLRRYGYVFSKVRRVRQFHHFLCNQVFVGGAGTRVVSDDAELVPCDVWELVPHLSIRLILLVLGVHTHDSVVDAALKDANAQVILGTPLGRASEDLQAAMIKHVVRQFRFLVNLVECVRYMGLIVEDQAARETAAASDAAATHPLLQRLVALGCTPPSETMRGLLCKVVYAKGFMSLDNVQLVPPGHVDAGTAASEGLQRMDMSDGRSRRILWLQLINRHPEFMRHLPSSGRANSWQPSKTGGTSETGGDNDGDDEDDKDSNIDKDEDDEDEDEHDAVDDADGRVVAPKSAARRRAEEAAAPKRAKRIRLSKDDSKASTDAPPSEGTSDDDMDHGEDAHQRRVRTYWSPDAEATLETALVVLASTQAARPLSLKAQSALITQAFFPNLPEDTVQRRLQRARKKEDVRIFVETQASHRSQLRTAQLDDFAHVLALGIDVRAPAETPEQLREQVQAWQQFSRSMPVVPLMPLRADERLPATVAAIEASYLVESVLYPEDRTTGSSASETEHWRVPAVNGASSIIAISQAMLADPLSVTAPSPWQPAHGGARTASAAPLHTAALATLASGSTTRRPPAEANEATLGMWTTAALVQAAVARSMANDEAAAAIQAALQEIDPKVLARAVEYLLKANIIQKRPGLPTHAEAEDAPPAFEPTFYEISDRLTRVVDRPPDAINLQLPRVAAALESLHANHTEDDMVLDLIPAALNDGSMVAAALTIGTLAPHIYQVNVSAEKLEEEQQLDRKRVSVSSVPICPVTMDAKSTVNLLHRWIGTSGELVKFAATQWPASQWPEAMSGAAFGRLMRLGMTTGPENRALVVAAVRCAERVMAVLTAAGPAGVTEGDLIATLNTVYSAHTVRIAVADVVALNLAWRTGIDGCRLCMVAGGPLTPRPWLTVTRSVDTDRFKKYCWQVALAVAITPGAIEATPARLPLPTVLTPPESLELVDRLLSFGALDCRVTPEQTSFFLTPTALLQGASW